MLAHFRREIVQSEFVNTPISMARNLDFNSTWQDCCSNGRTHGVAVDRKNNLYILHQESPAIKVYDEQGTFIHSWRYYPGAHGPTLVQEGDNEFLWLTDQDKATVEKTTLHGTVCQSIGKPDLGNGKNMLRRGLRKMKSATGETVTFGSRMVTGVVE